LEGDILNKIKPELSMGKKTIEVRRTFWGKISQTHKNGVEMFLNDGYDYLFLVLHHYLKHFITCCSFSI